MFVRFVASYNSFRMKSQHTILIFLFFIVCIPLSKAQSMYVHFKNGDQESYPLISVQSITFTDQVMNVNKKDGTSVSWNINNIIYYKYDGSLLNLPKEEKTFFTDLEVYPNPANGSIYLQFQIEQASIVTIELNDITGKVIKRLPQTQYAMGKQVIPWNGTDDNGNAVPSGIYFIKIAIGDRIVSRKIIINN